MATNTVPDLRQYDRRLFAAVAILFPLIVLLGFGRTYYLKPAFTSPPVPSLMVHAHAVAMGAWVALFIVQTWLIRTRNVKAHMSLGMFGIALAVVIVVTGFFTAVAAAKFGSTSTPPDVAPLQFLIIPMTDLPLFAGVFAAAVWLRKRAADHKRLMLLVMILLLPPAIARFPFEFVPVLGPVLFLGAPSLLCIAFIVYDRWRTGKFNRPFVIGAAVLIASYVLRLGLMGTDAWMGVATWLTAWAA